MIHQPVVTFADQGAGLSVYAASVTGEVYHLTFADELLFYADQLTDWSQEYTVDVFEGKVPVLLESVDANRVIVGCEDGSAFVLEVAQGELQFPTWQTQSRYHQLIGS